ncbi:unnamed protein product [Candidula unifasciata]|uniref:N-acetyltransferase 9-like protein n=1 Tax=Candidula unifasciata TaxID=100452 RepID=A0A8S3YX11_9EUPU|nr:unnamed protein product [Candidula unifasciata]
MKENRAIRVWGSRVLLVPYEAHHVMKYHSWMESEELRELTASERLSLEEEYDMQRKWRQDSDKCTFIILDRKHFEQNATIDRQSREIEAMVGDVNIFYPPDSHGRVEGEIEIMIAEPSARGRGLGKEALCSMMRYAQESLKTRTFTSKIGFGNVASLQLFHSLGFEEVSRSDVFQEVTLSFDASDPTVFFPWTKDYFTETIET